VNSPVRQYQQLDVETAVSSANPHQLIEMLFRGARDRLNQARGAIEHHDIESKTQSINACIEIIQGLQASLDHDQGGDIAEWAERATRIGRDHDVDTPDHNETAVLATHRHHDGRHEKRGG